MENSKEDIYVLAWTPGLDSFLTDYNLRKDATKITRVYCDLNSRYSTNELEFLDLMYADNYFEISHNLNINDIEQTDAYVPNRNLLIATILQGKYDADRVYLSGVLDDRVSDQGFNFYGRASSVLSDIAGKDVIVSSMLGYKEKTTWCLDYVNENTGKEKFNLISNTYSCFESDWYSQTLPIYMKWEDKYIQISEETVVGCRRCPACYRRLCAIAGAGMYVPFINTDLVINYISKIDKNEFPHRYNAAVVYSNFVRKIRLQ